jgi:hypothetical protein
MLTIRHIGRYFFVGLALAVGTGERGFFIRVSVD